LISTPINWFCIFGFSTKRSQEQPFPPSLACPSSQAPFNSIGMRGPTPNHSHHGHLSFLIMGTFPSSSLAPFLPHHWHLSFLFIFTVGMRLDPDRSLLVCGWTLIVGLWIGSRTKPLFLVTLNQDTTSMRIAMLLLMIGLGSLTTTLYVLWQLLKLSP